MSMSMPISQTVIAEAPAEQEDSDFDLVVRAQQDTRVFALLYARYLDKVHQYCYRRLESREAAEDATSQIFLQSLAALPRYSPGKGTFRSWLFTIAHNVVIDQYRAKHPIGSLNDEMVIFDRTASPEDQAVAADEGRALRLAIAQLPERQRQVVELRLAGLNGPEIGQVLGCKPRTVDVAQFRAVAKLRVLMNVPGRLEGEAV